MEATGIFIQFIVHVLDLIYKNVDVFGFLCVLFSSRIFESMNEQCCQHLGRKDVNYGHGMLMLMLYSSRSCWSGFRFLCSRSSYRCSDVSEVRPSSECEKYKSKFISRMKHVESTTRICSFCQCERK